MVTVHNAHVGVSGRLLDINSIAMSVTSFPDLTATVQMTSYILPATEATEGAAADGAATPAAAAAPAAVPAAATTPAATN
jgi:hypothetical protein